MDYLCEKQLTAGGKVYYPGTIIPDGIILSERSNKLKRNGYISEWNGQIGSAETEPSTSDSTSSISRKDEADREKTKQIEKKRMEKRKGGELCDKEL